MDETRERPPTTRNLVLAGGGHSHVEVLRRFGDQPLGDVHLTLIGRERHTPYSGMLPGLVAGHYRFEEAHIDLVPLARHAGARFVHDEVTGIDAVSRKVFCKGGPPVPYDILSINTGSTPAVSDVPGAAGQVIPVKPISNFIERWEQLRARVLSARGPKKIGVVGAGAGGVEMILAIQYALGRALGRALDDSQPAQLRMEFHLFSSGEILPTHNPGVRSRFLRVLARRGVQVHQDKPVISVSAGKVRLSDHAEIELDEILWVTQAGAPSWIREAGLAVDDRGFLRVADTLESVSHPGVFAAGDVAAVDGHAREKAGVFAVRQGPPLAENLRRALCGHPLKPYLPQKKFLGLISTGDQYAVASRGNWSLEGRYVWRIKDWIDRRFMTRYKKC